MLANFYNKITESTAYKKFRAVLSCVFHYIHKKMFFGIFSKFDEKFFKFIFVGLLNTFVSYVLYAFFVAIGLVANLALFFQYIFGVLWNFKTTGSIVFKNNDNRLLFKFVLSYVFTFFLNSILLNFLIKYVNEYFAQAILIFPVALTSFVILKFWVFRK